TIGTDFGGHVAALGARIDGDMLTDNGFGPDAERARLAVILHVLTCLADLGEWIYATVRSERGAAGNDGVGQNRHAVAELDVRSDQAKGTDLDAGPKFCAWID